MSVLSTFLAGKGLSILASAVKVGLGYGKDGKDGAIAAAAQALGMADNSSEQAIVEAAKSDPDAAAKLLEVQNAIPLAQIQADKEELAAELFTERELASLEIQDRSNARQMFTATNEGTPKHLTWLICLLWIGMVGALFFVQIPPENRELIIRMQGTLDGAIASAIMFWLGSSFGSRKKDDRALGKDVEQ